MQSLACKLRSEAFAPVDIASLVFFRIAFGFLLVWHVCSYLAKGLIGPNWLEPRFLFKYYGFSWVHPWPGNWLYVHWAAVGVFALLLALGFLYRASAILLFFSYTYFFLLDQARYVNHTYLICLFGFLMIFVPAHRAFSIDTWLRPKMRAQTTPAWTLWLLRAQMGVVYFYGGIAKISSDWLQGEPLRTWMAQNNNVPIVGRFFGREWAVSAGSFGSLLFDLLIAPLLLWRRTRLPAFFAVLAFHLVNAKWFTIGIFPWLAIAASTLFLSPSWPRQVLSKLRLAVPFSPVGQGQPSSPRRKAIVLSFVAIYLAIQILVPLRHFLSAGGIEWNHMEHAFSWRMMLLKYNSIVYFYVTDPNIGKTYRVNPRQFLNMRQRAALTFNPDLPLQFAHYLAAVMPRRGPQPLKVEARISLSINGRKPELFIDPNVDLAAEPRSFGRPRWLLPIRESLPPPDKAYTQANLEPATTGGE